MLSFKYPIPQLQLEQSNPLTFPVKWQWSTASLLLLLLLLLHIAQQLFCKIRMELYSSIVMLNLFFKFHCHVFCGFRCSYFRFVLPIDSLFEWFHSLRHCLHCEANPPLCDLFLVKFLSSNGSIFLHWLHFFVIKFSFMISSAGDVVRPSYFQKKGWVYNG